MLSDSVVIQRACFHPIIANVIYIFVTYNGDQSNANRSEEYGSV